MRTEIEKLNIIKINGLGNSEIREHINGVSSVVDAHLPVKEIG